MDRQANKLSERDTLIIPAHFIPTFRTSIAIERGVERNLLFRTWGGIGDQICAEPTLRYALRTFKGCDVSLASERPELFRHLHGSFKEIFDLRKEKPTHESYLSFETITAPNESNLVWQFMSHMLVNCVDFPSLCALRCQLPVADKEVRLEPTDDDFSASWLHVNSAQLERCVAVHAGRHWQSKTFPKEWWDQVINYLLIKNATPVLIGDNTDENRGTVNVNAAGCIDLRGKLSIMQTVALLKHARVLLTNDSAPLHMAAAGSAWIGFIATCKHPDYIMHWRKGEWAWRMKNFGLSGIWDVLDYCPNKAQNVEAENVGDELLRSWLPEPATFAAWAVNKLTD